MTEYTDAQAKALTLGKSISVTAGAGTGKTFLLTQRYIALLESGARPKDIVALTYTEKAAAEMQTKISRELKKRSKEDARMQEAFDTIQQAVISTFHGFCLSILKEFAYEAGLEPGFSIMDDLDKAELVENTIRKIMEQPDDELFDTLVRLHLRLSPSTINSAIKLLITKDNAEWFALLRDEPDTVRRVWLRACKEHFALTDELISLFADVSEDEALYSLRRIFFEDPVNRSLLNRLGTADAKHLTQGRKRYYELGKALKEAATPKEIRRICAEYGTSKVTGKQGFVIPDNERDRAAEFISLFNALLVLPGKDSTVFSITREVLLDLFEVSRVCAEKIAGKKRREGVLDFDDLIQKTDELLSEKHPEILKTVSERCRYVLVDEVQDNDPALVRLLQKICGNIAENDRLFIVGDAKQSIYLFRGADSAGYEEFQKVFGKNRTALDTSFRSVPEIINFVNELFAAIFTGPLDPAYDAVVPHRSSAAGSVELICLPQDKENGVRTEAETLASWISDRIENKKLTITEEDGTKRPAEYADVAILLRRRRRLAELCAALEKYQVPYSEEGGKDFYHRQEVADFFHLLSAVIYPEDDIPLYGALRSPYCAVPDAELEQAAFGSYQTLYERLQRFSQENPESRTAKALENLSRWREDVHHLPVSAALEKIVSESEILSVYAGHPSGDRMEGNLMKLLNVARGKAESRAFSIYEFVSLLEKSMASGVTDGEGEPLEERGGRVRIITIHSSKGLEYPVVCLCFAGESMPERGKVLEFDEKLGVGVRIKPPGMEKSVGLLHLVLEEERKARAAAENKRLFYVALTRARDHLVLCGTAETKDGYAKSSFMQMYEGAAGQLTTQPAVCEGQCCFPPEAQESAAAYCADAVCTIPVRPEEERVSVLRDVAFAMQRGSRLHAAFARKTVEGEFAGEYQAFLDSPLMKEVVFEQCEMPILCGTERRVIDRFVQYADGSYAVIDYKTGSIATAKERGLFDSYAEQVSEYVELMRQMTGGVVSGWLYFADEEEGMRIVPLTEGLTE